MKGTVGGLAIISILVAACPNYVAPIAPIMGTIQIIVSTSSAESDIDRDGYTLSIDGGPDKIIAINDTLTTPALPKGAHLVRLSGIALNCSAVTTDRWVNIVTENTIVSVSFLVTCSGWTD